jgi:hypothetical protein
VKFWKFPWFTDVWQVEQLSQTPRCGPEKMGKKRLSWSRKSASAKSEVLWHVWHWIGNPERTWSGWARR